MELIVLKDKRFGCIPWSFEWVIRYQNFQNVDFKRFQCDFNFYESNGYGLVAQKVKERYPQIDIKTQGFEHGSDKVNFIKQKIEKDIPCVMALIDPQSGNFHSVPIVEIDDIRMKVIWDADTYGYQICELPIQMVIRAHDAQANGRDIAWLEK